MSNWLDYFRKNIPVFILLGIVSILFVYFVSYSTSPFYPYYFGNDSAQFQTIGKAWSDGLIPYLDIFDHKGPFIFFVNMLGFLLTNSSLGVMIVQIAFLFVTLVIFYKMTQMVSTSKIYGLTVIAIALSNFYFTYSEGNLSEEYCLPFISISTYFQVKYLTNSSNKKLLVHKPFYAFIYGASFGICLLTRVTNGVMICAGTLVICILLLKNKAYRNLLWNSAGFIAGFLLIFFPFAIYFAMHRGFYDFIYGTLLFNIKYQSQMTSWLTYATPFAWLKFTVVHFTSYIIFVVAVLSFRRHKYEMAVYCILCGILETYIFMSGAAYPHYAIITLPQAIIFCNELYLLQRKDRVDSIIKMSFSSLTVIFSILCIIVAATRIVHWHNEYKDYHEMGYEQLLNMIPEDELDSFIAYGGDELKPIYLLNDITPCYKYFAIQEWHSSFTEEIRDDIWEVFSDGDAKWILSRGSTGVIQDILDSRYNLVSESGDFKLYHLGEVNISPVH